jgi:hypothetical protein
MKPKKPTFLSAFGGILDFIRKDKRYCCCDDSPDKASAAIFGGTYADNSLGAFWFVLTLAAPAAARSGLGCEAG